MLYWGMPPDPSVPGELTTPLNAWPEGSHGLKGNNVPDPVPRVLGRDHLVVLLVGVVTDPVSSASRVNHIVDN
jgi:hypothetical protein